MFALLSYTYKSDLMPKCDSVTWRILWGVSISLKYEATDGSEVKCTQPLTADKVAPRNKAVARYASSNKSDSPACTCDTTFSQSPSEFCVRGPTALWRFRPDRSFKLNDWGNIPAGLLCLFFSDVCLAKRPCVRFSIYTLRACSYLRACLRVFTQAAFAFSVQSLDKLNGSSSSCSFWKLSAIVSSEHTAFPVRTRACTHTHLHATHKRTQAT